jgi:hypothetical protein
MTIPSSIHYKFSNKRHKYKATGPPAVVVGSCILHMSQNPQKHHAQKSQKTTTGMYTTLPSLDVLFAVPRSPSGPSCS